ncbi:hypothetical protein DLL96_21130 [Salmonella enterica subsp. enterica serovar Bredeney]|nr:hypothetical protein [Salmonella enterica subsp. enterica serovar Bredeney]EBU8285458.1 hypothetical protein [Salmonella enterica subsp. enterica serovar Bredeney]
MMKFTPELFSLPGFCCEVNQIRYYVLGTRTNQWGCGFCMADTNIIFTVIINNHYIDEFIIFFFYVFEIIGSNI